MSELLCATLAAFFDRLCAGPDAPGNDAALLDAAGLQASIERDLARLLNTRSRLDLDTYCLTDVSVVDYGLPDFSALSPGSGDDLLRLEGAVRHAITCFEPRLLDARVTVSRWGGATERALMNVEASVRIGRVLRRVQFELATEPRLEAAIQGAH